MVLLHGLNGHSGTWRNNVSHFASRYRVIAPSLPVFRGPMNQVPIERYADHVEELLKRILVPESIVIFVGNSMGGWISMLLAIRRAFNAQSIVLEDTAGVRQEKSRESLARALEQGGYRVQIIWGSKDPVIPLEIGREFASKLPSARFTIVDSAGHVPHWDSPQEFNSIVDAFLKST